MIKLPEPVAWLSFSVGRVYQILPSGFLNSEQVLDPIYTESQLKQAVQDAVEELKQPPAPDCRTCMNYVHDDDHPQCQLWNGCTNGDQYKPAPAVVLWRTES